MKEKTTSINEILKAIDNRFDFNSYIQYNKAYFEEFKEDYQKGYHTLQDAIALIDANISANNQILELYKKDVTEEARKKAGLEDKLQSIVNELELFKKEINK
jgi:hypothetical protein